VCSSDLGILGGQFDMDLKINWIAEYSNDIQ
jgi:hypothetical protein